MCRCTCGGCDCPQIKVNWLPDANAAPPVGFPVYIPNAAAGQVITIKYDAGVCAAAAPNVYLHEMIRL